MLQTLDSSRCMLPTFLFLVLPRRKQHFRKFILAKEASPFEPQHTFAFDYLLSVLPSLEGVTSFSYQSNDPRLNNLYVSDIKEDPRMAAFASFTSTITTVEASHLNGVYPALINPDMQRLRLFTSAKRIDLHISYGERHPRGSLLPLRDALAAFRNLEHLSIDSGGTPAFAFDTTAWSKVPWESATTLKSLGWKSSRFTAGILEIASIFASSLEHVDLDIANEAKYDMGPLADEINPLLPRLWSFTFRGRPDGFGNPLLAFFHPSPLTRLALSYTEEINLDEADFDILVSITPFLPTLRHLSLVCETAYPLVVCDAPFLGEWCAGRGVSLDRRVLNPFRRRTTWSSSTAYGEVDGEVDDALDAIASVLAFGERRTKALRGLDDPRAVRDLLDSLRGLREMQECEED